jgi:hypothetical protein
MTSSSSSSSSRLAVVLLAALALAGCRGARPAPEPGPGPRLALFPVQNLTGGAAPVKELTAALRERLVERGVSLAPEEGVLRTLAARRIRYTGGIDRETAVALRDEAGVDGVIIASLEAWGPNAPYRMAMTTRLVSTDAEPVIRWLDAFARSGVDAPGLLGVGIVPDMEQLRDRTLDQVASSLASSLKDPHPARPCPDRASRTPDRMFRSPIAADPERRTIAVLPFLNDAGRRDAGEVVALRVLAPLVASGTIRVVEPGVARAEMLAYRLGASGGISLDDARVILKLLGADLVISGTVRIFEDAAGTSGAPHVDLSTWVLDRETGQLAWSSTTSAAGDDGVWFFGLGRITTASALTCSVAKGAVGLLLRDRPPVTDRTPPAGIAQPSEASARTARR